MSFFKELRRRNVIKVAAAYLVVSWLIMQVAEVLIPALHLPDWVLTATLYFLAIGFLPALIGAWAFELTPEGIRREKKVDPEQSITTQTGRKLDFLVIGLLAVGIIYLMIDKFWLEDGVETAATVSPQGEVVEAEEVAPSIAVLPFVNMSADADNEYFSDGVSEEILNVLTGIENLKVTARTSAFSYKGSKLKIDEIARELGVNHILEGSVRKSGDQVRVTAQLIRADGGFHLWSETYDRKLDNIFAIQDEIAGEIAAALQVTLELEPERENFTGTNSTQAYEAFLRGVNLWHLRNGQALQDAVEQFDTAIAIDPEFARAHAYRAMTWAVISDYTEIPLSLSRPQALRSAEVAMTLDPNSIEAASVLILTTDDLDQKLEAARHAIALNPGFATAHQWYAGSLVLAGDLDTARVEFQRALELDPRSRVTHQNLVALHITLEQWDQARNVAENALSFAPEYWPVSMQLFAIALYEGNREAAAALGHELAAGLRRRVDATDRYLALFFEPENRAAALAEIMRFPLEDFDNPDNPSLLDYWNLPDTLARAGAVTETLELLRWQQRNKASGSWGTLRHAKGIPEVLCHPDVQAFYAEADLPPLANPPDCAGG